MNVHTTEEEKDVDLMIQCSRENMGDKRFSFVNWLVLLLAAISLLYLSAYLFFRLSLSLSHIALYLLFPFFLLSLRLILLLVCVNSRIADMLSSSCPDTWNPTKSFLHLHTAYMYSPRVKKKVCVCLLQQRKRDPAHIYSKGASRGANTHSCFVWLLAHDSVRV
jgi:hypothetical protein